MIERDAPVSARQSIRRSDAFITNPDGPQLELLKVVCTPGSAITEELHTFVVAFTRLRYRPTVAERISLTSYELFANALNYGSVNRMVTLVLSEDSDAALVTVSNESISARSKQLVERCAQLAQDPKAVYMEELRRNVTGGIPRAMLGLARIVYEAKVELSATVDGNLVTVLGRCRL
jgi:hypothetical protein